MYISILQKTVIGVRTALKKSNCKSAQVIISALGLAVMAAAFILWNIYGTSAGIAPRIAALISAILFCILCLRFVPAWLEFWSRDDRLRGIYADAPADGKMPKHIMLRIFVSLLAVNAAVILIVFLIRLSTGAAASFKAYLNFWTCTDSAHYLDIARDWYLSEGDHDRLVQLVFLPGYPIAVRLAAFIVGNYLYAALLVSSLCFAGAGCVFYRLLRLDISHADSIRALKYACILPGAFFYAAPMSESLFWLLSLACIYCSRRRHWFFSCLLGGAAAFTRSIGLALFVPVLFEMVSDSVKGLTGRHTRHRSVLRFFLLLLIPAGFGAYCLINYCVSGDPFKYMEYQAEHWGQHLGLFFNTAAYQLDNAVSCLGHDNRKLLGLWLPNLLCSFGSLCIMIPAVKNLRASYTAYFISYYVIAIGATWLLSAPRYLCALFPIPAAISTITRRGRSDAAMSGILAAAYGLYLIAFVLRWQVW